MNINDFMKDFTTDFLKAMPENKKRALHNACDRNDVLTSYFGLSNQTIHVYKEGWYVELYGTRCAFKAWAYDNDGDFVFSRKPKENKLHKLYSLSFYGLYKIEMYDIFHN